MKKVCIFLSYMAIMLFTWSCSNDVENIPFDKGNSDIETRSTEHKFPDISTIRSNSEVISKMNEAWSSMKSFASKNGRREYGFYIYYDEANDRIYCGDLQEGPIISDCEGTHGTMDLEPDVPATFNQTVCAHFHCHTTLQYCYDVERRTGPSSADISLVNTRKLPGLLYDYSASTIYGGDSKDASYEVTTYGSYSQRPSIYY